MRGGAAELVQCGGPGSLPVNYLITLILPEHIGSIETSCIVIIIRLKCNTKKVAIRIHFLNMLLGATKSVEQSRIIVSVGHFKLMLPISCNVHV